MNINDFLTPKQRAFCDEYLLDRNATAAALRAGYSKSIALNGYLMTIPKIKQHLKERSDQAAEKVQVNHDMVLRELCKIAFGNLHSYFLPDGELKPIHELTADETAALWSVSITGKGAENKNTAHGGMVKMRMYNKLTALDKIAKHLNFYKPEAAEPEKVYIYLNEAELRADDFYGEEEKQQQPCGKNNNFFDNEPIADVPVGTDGNILCDRDGKLKFKVELNQTFDENLARLEMYEDTLKRPIEKAWVDAETDANHLLLPLYEEINLRLKRAGANIGGYDNEVLCFKFMFLRRMENRPKIPTFTHG